jgi:hypothetical protein
MTAGGVVSSLTVTVPVVDWPAAFVALHDSAVPAV